MMTPHAPPRSLLILCFSVAAGCNGLATSRPPTRGAAPVRAAASRPIVAIVPFTETVPGSTAKFAMRPLPVVGGPAGKPLWIGQTEVTWDAYDVFLLRLDLPEDKRTSAEADTGPDAITRPTLPYNPPDRGWGHDGFPAIGVTSEAASRYCRWLSQKTGRRYRLPTVGEWRSACRAAMADQTPATAPDSPVGRGAWFADNAGDTTHAVATRAPNALGLYDLLGNAAEWCSDADGRPVVCGGSFRTPRRDLSCDLVERQEPAWQASDPSLPKSKWWLADAPFVGFRVVCEGD